MPREPKVKADKGDGPAKRATKEKKTKDPNAPKRPLSAYMFYSKDVREDTKSENPDATFGELGKILGSKWSGLSEEEKAPYHDQAAKDKERYTEEQAAYAEKNPDAVPAKKEKKAPAAKKPKKKSAEEVEEPDEAELEEDEE